MYLGRLLILWFTLATAFILSSACSSSSDSESCTPGLAGCPCASDGSCQDGSACGSNGYCPAVSNITGDSDGSDGDADSDADNDADSDADNDADSDADNDADSDADNDADSDADNDADSDADNDADSDADNDADSDADNDADSDADNDSDTDADNDADSDTDTDADNDADSDTDTDADSDTDTDADSDTDADTGTSEPLGGYHVHGNWAGFAFTFATDADITPDADTGYNDMLEDDGPYCASGTVKGTEDWHSIAAVGFNVSQPKVEDAEVNTISTSGTGLLVDITNNTSSSLRVQLEDGTDPDDPDAADHRWCVNISDFGSGGTVIPWESFNTQCWDPDEGDSFDPSTPLAKVIVYLPDAGSSGGDQSFDFCVNDIGPEDVDSRGEGEIVGSCGASTSWPSSSASGTDSFTSNDGSYGFQANGWDMQGGSLSISVLDSIGFKVNSHSCNKTEATDGPCSYPSVYRGVRYGGENTTSSGGFPKQVSQISSIPTCLGWSAGQGNGYNVSFDVWFSSNSGATTAEKFLMLWFKTPVNWQPAGDFPEADGVMIGSQVWSRWYGKNTDGQYVTTYAAPTDRAEGQAYSFDLKDFIDDAMDKGHISSSDYLISVMGGVEIWSGGTGASITSFRTEVQ